MEDSQPSPPADPLELNEEAWRLVGHDHPRALTLATRAAELARQRRDPVGRATALRTIGACEIRQGHHPAARDHLRTSFGLLEDHDGDSGVLADVHHLLLRTYFLDQRIEDALEVGQKGLRAAQATGDARLEARALNDIGIVYASSNAYPQALEHLLSSVQLFERSSIPVTGSPLNNIGNIYLLQEYPEDALNYFERARETFHTEGFAREEALALGNIGRAYEALGQLDRAKRHHEHAVEIARGLPDAMDLPSALTKLGAALTKNGEHEQARTCLEEALEAFDRHPSTFRNETRLALVESHLATHRPDEAIALLNVMLEEATATGNSSLLLSVHEALSRASEASGDPARALEHHRQYHALHSEQERAIFSSQARATLLQHEVDRAQHEKDALHTKHVELEDAYGQLRTLHEALGRQAMEFERLGYEDSLTALHNRRALERRMREEIARVKRYGGTFSMLMLDIDDFKRLNDTYSHAVGDEVLVRIGTLLRNRMRVADTPARFGGEEFVVLLPNTDLAAAVTAAEQVRHLIESHPWHEVHTNLRVTTSIGVVQGHPGDSMSAILGAADARLYRAKRRGKNRVVSS